MSGNKGGSERITRPVEIASDGYRADIDWHDEKGRTYQAKLTMEPSGAITGLDISGGNIGSSAIRSLRLERVRAAIRDQVEEQGRQARLTYQELATRAPAGRSDLTLMAHRGLEWSEAVGRLVRDFKERPRPGAAGRSDRHYAAIAAMYVQVLGHRNPAAIVGGRLGYSSKTIQNYLTQARSRKVLTEPAPGCAGGELTEYGRSLLASPSG